ncbi:hypothetical protein EYD45_12435 [Hyunsoonleella flava]|uniref:TonB C-terminal domain-containing protein n=1 Tax=Hyunsoonleella flava TaxID=2527939 RepID=A0A4Q9FCQ6_9FLAO|nr:energy transducer TonB [Hyunsoonleella flava]TBN01831.1 hypothetical protein EYD45_12435 [Hyunsoonleella flava]
MKNSKQSHDIVRQNDDSVKQSHRHDANLQKNSTLYFQVGLIVCLLAAIGLLEMQFETKTTDIALEHKKPTDVFDMEAINFKPYEEPKQKQRVEKQEKAAKKFIDKIEEVKNDTDLPEDIVETLEEATSDVPIDPSTFNKIEKPIEEVFDIRAVEQVPIYPGCENKKGNKARKKCMSDKIGRLVQKRFNGGIIASREGLSGTQRIFVQFQIDKLGYVTDIKTNTKSVRLGDEAQRVVNKIPQMLPGKQNNKPVSVRYTLPITFIAE